MGRAPKPARELIACGDCGAMVSFSAMGCPRCGSRGPDGAYVTNARERRRFGSLWESDRILIGMVVLCGGNGVFCGAVIGDEGTALGYGFVGAGVGVSAGFIINLTRRLFGYVASARKRPQIHRAAGAQLPTRLFKMDLGLLDRLPAEDRDQLMGGRIVLGGHGRSRLAEHVGASGDTGLGAPLPEPVTQSLYREPPLLDGFQECEAIQRSAGQDRVELWPGQDHLIERLRAAVLVLATSNPAAAMDFSHQRADTLRHIA